MSDQNDRTPVDQATIDCWRVNYGLDKRTPADAAKWWADTASGLAPSGCVAALGIALDELDAMRKAASQQSADALDAARYRRIRQGQHWSVINGIGDALRADALDAAIDAAMARESAAIGGAR